MAAVPSCGRWWAEEWPPSVLCVRVLILSVELLWLHRHPKAPPASTWGSRFHLEICWEDIDIEAVAGPVDCLGPITFKMQLWQRAEPQLFSLKRQSTFPALEFVWALELA